MAECDGPPKYKQQKRFYKTESVFTAVQQKPILDKENSSWQIAGAGGASNGMHIQEGFRMNEITLSTVPS